MQKEEELEQKKSSLELQQKNLEKFQKEIGEKIAELDELKAQYQGKLAKISKLDPEEIRTDYLRLVEESAKTQAAKTITAAIAKAKEEAKTKAKEILVTEMVHGATEYVAEYTVSVIKLPDEETKGKIIGKGGNNIRAIELSAGVDLELDDENQIRISCFDAVRREIARIAIQRLIADGRIQPSRIEEIIAQVREEIDKIIHDEGIKLAQAVGVYSIPEEITNLLGRFKYRFSYGQSMITHTLEETKVGVALANEVGADVNVVKLGCLLHDIGKVVESEEGSHISLGVDLLKKYKLPQAVIDCVAQHHEDEPFTSVESMLVYIADAISGARPGARYEDLEKYVSRMKDLENICKNFKGVSDVWMYQAGREIRCLVDPKIIDDDDAVILAERVRDEIEKQVKDFPGQIHITVIREVRAESTTR